MSNKKGKSNYMKQGGVRAVASWLILLIVFVKMIYLSYKNGMSGMTYYGFSVSVYILLYSLLGMAVVPVLRKLVYFQVNKGSHKNAVRIYHVILCFSMVVTLVVAIVLFAFSQLLSSVLFGTVLCSLLFKILALALVVSVPFFCIRGYLEGLGNPMPGVAADIISQVTGLLMTILTQPAFSDYGRKVAELVRVEDYAYAYSVCSGAVGLAAGGIAGLLFMLLIQAVLRKDLKSGIRGDENRNTDSGTDIIWNYVSIYASEMLEKQVGIFLSVVLMVLYCRTAGRAENGGGMLYTGVFWLMVPLLITAEQMGVPFSRQLTTIMKRLDYHHARERLAVYLKVLSYNIFPYVAFMFGIAGTVGKAFFDVETTDFPGIIRSGILAGGITALAVFFRYVSGVVLKSFLRNLFAVVSVIAGVFFFFVINRSGTAPEKSYIYALMLAWLLYLLMQCLVLLKKMRIYDQLIKSVVLPFAASVLMGVLVFGISALLSGILGAWMTVLVAGVAGYFLYNMFIVVLRVFESHEWTEVPVRKFPVFFTKVLKRY